jgi:hypothetical protein
MQMCALIEKMGCSNSVLLPPRGAYEGSRMKRSILKGLYAVVLLAPAQSASADHYVRSGGVCTSNCNSWTNAAGQITTAIAAASRGDTIWVGGGNYSAITLNKPASAGMPITITKATSPNHGTSVGWSASYDGQAIITSVTAITNDWVLDGQTRDESNWSNTAAYGFRITNAVVAHTINFKTGSSNMTFRYVDIGGPPGDAYSTSIPDSGFYLGGFGSVLRNWTITRTHIHNVKLPFMLVDVSDSTIEYSVLGPNWNKETIRGQGRASNIVIRHNLFKDGCQGLPGDPTAGGCTAEIAMWGSNSAGAYDGSQIYGNVIWTTKTTHHTDGCIMIGGDGGVTAHGVAANNVAVYNNTFVGIRSGTCNIRFPGSRTGVVARNNLWYGLGDNVSAQCSANTCSNNLAITSPSPFINASIGDFRLSGATSAGFVLPSPYNTDRTGAIRGADGGFDIGAYEYISGAAPPPSPQPPTALSAIVSSP